MKAVLGLLALCLVMTINLAPAGAHTPKQKPVWEHTVDVHRFFKNHRQLQGHPVARRTLRQHDRLAYNALIWKWAGVHRCEGSWTDTGDPYWGGLQMDRQFQNSYGSEFVGWWGMASSWPAWAQMTAAERAYRSGRGFGPWPVCGAYGG